MRNGRKPKGLKTEGFVLDGSVALAWCFPDEKAAEPEAIMLQATPHGIFSWDYTILRGGAAIAEMDMSWFRERAEVKIGNEIYRVYRESILRGTFALQYGNQVVARAQKTSRFERAFEIDLTGRILRLQAISFWKRQFGLFENDRPRGRISAVRWLGRAAVIDLPDDIPIPVQVFLFYLVVVLWRREN